MIENTTTYKILIANEFQRVALTLSEIEGSFPVKTELVRRRLSVVASRSRDNQGGIMLRTLRFVFVMGALALFASGAHAQRDFTVGTATAAPGTKATGYIEVPAGVDPALQIPVVVVNGSKAGPVLAIVAGTHGTEYATIIAVERLIHLLDPKEISGTVILVPLVNVNSFLQKVPHLNPVDGKNMNRMFPGKPDGTQTDRASWFITKDVVAPSD